MKNVLKIATVFVLTLGTSSVLQAQETVTTSNSSGPSFGIKGGVNMSNLYVKDVDDENVLLGFNVGMFVELPVTSSISLQPELSFSTKGSEVTYSNVFAEGTSKFRLTYIEAPLLLRANITNNFNIHFGPYVAYLVDSKITNESSTGATSEEDINEDDLNRFDFGLAAGIGLQFGGVGIGARYNYGLTTVGKERTVLGETYTSPDGKNSVLSIFATIKL
ncbi:MAG: porin family protein [Bacteroidota bacterium]